ncbi:hypothetical protein RUND412_003988 [Rhizina undulata]
MATVLPASRPFTPRSSPSSSGPSTPMSGISTIAMNDGHLGARPNISSDFAADHISRLTQPDPNNPLVTGSSYFDYIRDPAHVSGCRATSDGFLSPTSSIASSIAGPQAQTPATPMTPLTEELDEFGRKRKKDGLDRPGGAGAPGFPSLVQQRVMANPSPASTMTTSSAAESRREARLVGGMTYDEGIVDTTDRPALLVREEVVLNEWTNNGDDDINEEGKPDL